MSSPRDRSRQGTGIPGAPAPDTRAPQPPGRPTKMPSGGAVDWTAGTLGNRQPQPTDRGQNVPAGPPELLRAYQGSDEGPYVGRSVIGDKEAPWSQTKRSFLSHFPGFDVRQWRRTVSVLASDVGLPAGPFPFGPVQRTLDTVPRAQARIITGVRLEWMQINYNPYGSPMPAGAPGYHDEMDNADGCVEFMLLANGQALMDVREQVYNYGAGGVGPATSRTINGWFKLHCNLLMDAGQHPSALFVQESSTITAQWTSVSNPNFTPDYLMATLDGWTCSFETLRRIQQAAGMSF